MSVENQKRTSSRILQLSPSQRDVAMTHMEALDQTINDHLKDINFRNEANYFSSMQKRSTDSPDPTRPNIGFGTSMPSQSVLQARGSGGLNNAISKIKFQKEVEGKQVPFRIAENNRQSSMRPYQSTTKKLTTNKSSAMSGSVGTGTFANDVSQQFETVPMSRVDSYFAQHALATVDHQYAMASPPLIQSPSPFANQQPDYVEPQILDNNLLQAEQSKTMLSPGQSIDSVENLQSVTVTNERNESHQQQKSFLVKNYPELMSAAGLQTSPTQNALSSNVISVGTHETVDLLPQNRPAVLFNNAQSRNQQPLDGAETIMNLKRMLANNDEMNAYQLASAFINQQNALLLGQQSIRSTSPRSPDSDRVVYGVSGQSIHLQSRMEMLIKKLDDHHQLQEQLKIEQLMAPGNKWKNHHNTSAQPSMSNTSLLQSELEARAFERRAIGLGKATSNPTGSAEPTSYMLGNSPAVSPRPGKFGVLNRSRDADATLEPMNPASMTPGADTTHSPRSPGMRHASPATKTIPESNELGLPQQNQDLQDALLLQSAFAIKHLSKPVNIRSQVALAVQGAASINTLAPATSKDATLAIDASKAQFEQSSATRVVEEKLLAAPTAAQHPASMSPFSKHEASREQLRGEPTFVKINGEQPRKGTGEGKSSPTPPGLVKDFGFGAKDKTIYDGAYIDTNLLDGDTHSMEAGLNMKYSPPAEESSSSKGRTPKAGYTCQDREELMEIVDESMAHNDITSKDYQPSRTIMEMRKQFPQVFGEPIEQGPILLQNSLRHPVSIPQELLVKMSYMTDQQIGQLLDQQYAEKMAALKLLQSARERSFHVDALHAFIPCKDVEMHLSPSQLTPIMEPTPGTSNASSAGVTRTENFARLTQQMENLAKDKKLNMMRIAKANLERLAQQQQPDAAYGIPEKGDRLNQLKMQIRKIRKEIQEDFKKATMLVEQTPMTGKLVEVSPARIAQKSVLSLGSMNMSEFREQEVDGVKRLVANPMARFLERDQTEGSLVTMAREGEFASPMNISIDKRQESGILHEVRESHENITPDDMRATSRDVRVPNTTRNSQKELVSQPEEADNEQQKMMPKSNSFTKVNTLAINSPKNVGTALNFMDGGVTSLKGAPRVTSPSAFGMSPIEKVNDDVRVTVDVKGQDLVANQSASFNLAMTHEEYSKRSHATKGAQTLSMTTLQLGDNHHPTLQILKTNGSTETLQNKQQGHVTHIREVINQKKVKLSKADVAGKTLIWRGSATIGLPDGLLKTRVETKKKQKNVTAQDRESLHQTLDTLANPEQYQKRRQQNKSVLPALTNIHSPEGKLKQQIQFPSVSKHNRKSPVLDVQRERQRTFCSSMTIFAEEAAKLGDTMNSTSFLIGKHGDEVSSKLHAFQRTRGEMQQTKTKMTEQPIKTVDEAATDATYVKLPSIVRMPDTSSAASSGARPSALGQVKVFDGNFTGSFTGNGITMQDFDKMISVGGIQLQKVPLEPHDPLNIGENNSSPKQGMSPITLGLINTLYPPTFQSTARSPKAVGGVPNAHLKSPTLFRTTFKTFQQYHQRNLNQNMVNVLKEPETPTKDDFNRRPFDQKQAAEITQSPQQQKQPSVGVKDRQEQVEMTDIGGSVASLAQTGDSALKQMASGLSLRSDKKINPSALARSSMPVACEEKESKSSVQDNTRGAASQLGVWDAKRADPKHFSSKMSVEQASESTNQMTGMKPQMQQILQKPDPSGGLKQPRKSLLPRESDAQTRNTQGFASAAQAKKKGLKSSNAAVLIKGDAYFDQQLQTVTEHNDRTDGSRTGGPTPTVPARSGEPTPMPLNYYQSMENVATGTEQTLQMYHQGSGVIRGPGHDSASSNYQQIPEMQPYLAGLDETLEGTIQRNDSQQILGSQRESGSLHSKPGQQAILARDFSFIGLQSNVASAMSSQQAAPVRVRHTEMQDVNTWDRNVTLQQRLMHQPSSKRMQHSTSNTSISATLNTSVKHLRQVSPADASNLQPVLTRMIQQQKELKSSVVARNISKLELETLEQIKAQANSTLAGIGHNRARTLCLEQLNLAKPQHQQRDEIHVSIGDRGNRAQAFSNERRASDLNQFLDSYFRDQSTDNVQLRNQRRNQAVAAPPFQTVNSAGLRPHFSKLNLGNNNKYENYVKHERALKMMVEQIPMTFIKSLHTGRARNKS